MIAELLVPFDYQYMVKAMWVSALVGGVCAFLSAYLMLKGWSLMGDALAHSIVPGVAGAYILGLPFALGAFIAGGLASIGMAAVKQRTRLREDTVIGVVFTSLFALGLLMASIWPTSVSVQTIVLGNILAISDEDVRPGRDHLGGLAAGPDAALEGPDGHLLRRKPRAQRRAQHRLAQDPVLHAAERLHGRRAADRWRLPRRRHGGDAGSHRLPAHRPLRPADPDQCRHGRPDQLRRRLSQLFRRRRDRRRDRHAADAALPGRLLSGAQARDPGRAPPPAEQCRSRSHDRRRSTGSSCR